MNLPGVSGGAAAVRRTASGTPLLVGYVASADPNFDVNAARAALAESLPAALVPAAGRSSTNCPPARRARWTATRCRGRRPGAAAPSDEPDLGGTMGWVAGLWRDVLGAQVDGPEADFFALGGGSLSAAQLVAALRARYPQVTVADLYDHPRLGSLAGFLDELDPPINGRPHASSQPTPRATQAAQVALSLPLATLTGSAVGDLAGDRQQRARPGRLADPGAAVAGPVNWWWIARRRSSLFITPLGPDGHRGVRRADAAVGGLRARHATAAAGRAPAGVVGRATGARPAAPRTWPARRGWCTTPARWATTVGKGVDLHSAAAGDRHAHAGTPAAPSNRRSTCPDTGSTATSSTSAPITIGDDATVGARTTLLPGAVVGKNADVAPGSGVVGKVKNGQYWKGSPAVKSGKARHPWPDHRPPRAPLWVAVYGVTSVLLGALPLVALGAGLARDRLGRPRRRDADRGDPARPRCGCRWPRWSPSSSTRR